MKGASLTLHSVDLQNANPEKWQKVTDENINILTRVCVRARGSVPLRNKNHSLPNSQHPHPNPILTKLNSDFVEKR